MSQTRKKKRRQLIKALRDFRRLSKLGESPLARQLESVVRYREQQELPNSPAGWGKAFQEVLKQAHQRMRPRGERDDGATAWRRYGLIEYRFFQGLPPLQVCERLGMSPEVTSTYYHWQTRALNELLERLEELRAAPRPSGPLPPFQAPPPLSTFIRRPEIEAALCQFLSGNSSASNSTVGALSGMGGTGKTALAAQLAYLLRDHFPDGMLWVEVKERDPLVILADLARAYGQELAGHRDLEGRAAAVRALLARKQALLILDDVQASAVPTLRHLLPPPPCKALITSRLRHLPGVSPEATWQLDVFSPDQALALLKRLLGQEQVAAHRRSAQTIAEQVGYLPLALDIVARRLALAPEGRLDEFASRLAQDHGQLAELDVGPDKTLNVRLSLRSSYESLSHRDRCRFRRLSVLVAPNFSPEVVSALAEETQGEAESGLTQLVERSLVQPVSESRYRLHPLVQAFGLEQLRAADEYARVRHLHADYYFSLARLRHRPADYFVLDRELENLTAALRWNYEQQEWSRLIRFVLLLVDYWQARGYWNEAERHLQMAVRASRELGDAQAEAELRNKLGLMRWNLGQLDEALAAHERAEQIAGQARNRKQALVALFSQGNVWLVRGDLETAQALYERVVAEAREGDALLVARAWNNLGEVYRHQGAWEEALSCYERCVDVAERVPEEESTGAKTIAAKAYGNTGIIYRLKSQLEKALEYHYKDLALKETLGDRPGRARTLVNLGNVYSDQDDFETSLQMYQSAAEIFREVGDLLSLVPVYNNLGDSYQELGQFEQALDFYERALQYSQQMGSLINTGESYAFMASCYLDMGDLDRALESCAQAEEIYERLNSPKDLAIVWKTRGDVYRKQGDFATARIWLEQALQTTKEAGHTRNLCFIYESLGHFYRAQDNFEKAATSYRTSQKIRKQLGYLAGRTRVQALLEETERQLGQ